MYHTNFKFARAKRKHVTDTIQKCISENNIMYAINLIMYAINLIMYAINLIVYALNETMSQIQYRNV